MQKRGYILRDLCWLLLLAAGIGAVVYGCLPGREEWRIVLQKAATICFECIGLR